MPRAFSRPIVISFLCVASFGADPESLRLAADQWRADLQFLARELPKKHMNAFHFISKVRFEAEVADLDQKLDRLNGDEVWVGMLRITSSIGEGHTALQLPRERAPFPLGIVRYGEDYRVSRVAPGLEKALGARLAKIDDTPIARARELIFPLTPQDELPGFSDLLTGNYLSSGGVLHGLGIVQKREHARYTLANDSGQEFLIEVDALTADVALQRGSPVCPASPRDLLVRLYC